MDLLIYGHTREWYNEYITKIFNYYNGRINKKYSAMIQINWVDTRDDSLGCLAVPGIVVINAGTIYRRTESEIIFVFNIILSIIHELYHADQYIDNVYFNDVDEYESSIEDPVYRMAANYVLSHMDEVVWVSDGIVDRNRIDYYYLLSKVKDGCNYIYNETDVTRYIFQSLAVILQLEAESVDVFAKMYYEIINNKGSLILDINNFRYMIICNGDIVTDYELINMYLRHTIKNSGEYCDFQIEVKNAGNKYMIFIKTKYKNPMCEIIEEK